MTKQEAAEIVERRELQSLRFLARVLEGTRDAEELEALAYMLLAAAKRKRRAA